MGRGRVEVQVPSSCQLNVYPFVLFLFYYYFPLLRNIFDAATTVGISAL